MRNITEIIIHCSATKEDRPVSVADIDRWHREKGCKEIGYHYVIYRDGSIHPGRALEKVGAHCLGHNQQSIGICYIGGLDKQGVPKDTRTPQQKEALVSLIQTFLLAYPNATVHGHNEFANKDCPCFNVQMEW